MTSSFTGNPNNFIPESYIFPDDNPEEYDVKLREYLNNIAAAVNTKDSGLYTDQEIITGQQFFPLYSTNKSANLNYRDVFRKVVNFGVLPNSGTKSVAHGITTTQNFSIVKFYGVATAPAASTISSVIPIPYVRVGAPTDGVQLDMGPTNVSITTTTANFVAFIRCFIVIEYIKLV